MITIVRDKTCVYYLSVYQYDGTTAQSLVGCTLWFHALVYDIAIDKSSGSGITITSSAGGLNCATLQIDPADTAGFPSSGTYVGPFELTLVQGSASYELLRAIGRLDLNATTVAAK